MFPAESTQQSLRRQFGYFKNKPSLKSFRRRPQARSVLKLEREENEKGLEVNRGGQLNRGEPR